MWKQSHITNFKFCYPPFLRRPWHWQQISKKKFAFTMSQCERTLKACSQLEKANEEAKEIKHPVGSTRISDWLENNFIMVVYENFFFQFVLWTDNSDWIFKKILIGKHYKTIFKSVRNACTSPRVSKDKRNRSKKKFRHHREIFRFCVRFRDLSVWMDPYIFFLSALLGLQQEQRNHD